MATSIGMMGEFDGTTEDWCSYTERLEHYFNVLWSLTGLTLKIRG